MKNNMRTKQQIKTNKKKAVSLIVLVITIIVMVILAGTIILSLNNSGIISKAEEAVEQTNLATVRELAQMAWASAYSIDATEQELQQAVDKALADNNVDTSKYIVEVTTRGVTVELKGTQSWIVATVDTVPIPKGFVASGATGENKKDTGLVIYEGIEPVTDANVEDSKRSRNQYVWVPVENFSDFKRQNFGMSYQTISNTLGSSYWEVVLDTATNMPLPTQDTEYMTSTTLGEVQAMYESVKEYKGFYIARYEAGIGAQRTADNYMDSEGNIIFASNVYSMMGKIPYNFMPWTKNNSLAEDTNGAVQVARSIYPETNTNYGVVSTLTYGVQWDRTLQWWLDTKAVSSVTNSTSYGNYADHVIAAGDLNDGAKYAVYSSSLGSYQNATTSSTKASGTIWALSTGALKAANINNIYDMAGNVREWTMEGVSADYRIVRGGGFNYYGDGSGSPVSNRYGVLPNNAGNSCYGFRPSLYIKK